MSYPCDVATLTDDHPAMEMLHARTKAVVAAHMTRCHRHRGLALLFEAATFCPLCFDVTCEGCGVSEPCGVRPNDLLNSKDEQEFDGHVCRLLDVLGAFCAQHFGCRQGKAVGFDA